MRNAGSIARVNAAPARRLAVVIALVFAAVWDVESGGQQPARKPDVFFAPTPQNVVEAMLRAVKVTRADVLYDLGSGDGRIPITAARMYGARAVGIELDPVLVRGAATDARTAGVSDKVRFLTQDLFTTNIGEATVVSMYLTPYLNFRLLPKLNKELKPGSRVVSHQWEMMDPADKYEYKPDQRIVIGNNVIYVWTIPIVRKPRSRSSLREEMSR